MVGNSIWLTTSV